MYARPRALFTPGTKAHASCVHVQDVPPALRIIARRAARLHLGEETVIVFSQQLVEHLERGIEVIRRDVLRRNGAPELAAPPGTRLSWPPPLVIPETLDVDAAPRDFLCPLTFDLMRQPAMTPQGSTYDFEAVARWADEQGRYPAGESVEQLSRDELAPNRVLRNMIEEWVAARCASTRRHASPPRIKMRVHRSGKSYD